jgi:hypothetical protein
MVREPSEGQRWSPPERTWGEYIDSTVLTGLPPINGLNLRANLYIETFECVGTSAPLLTYGGSCTGVLHTIGNNGGRAWLIGTYIGHCGTAYRSEANQNFIRGIFKECGIPTNPSGNLLLRKRVTPKKEAWIYTNPSGAEISAKIDVSGWSQVVDLLGDPIERLGDLISLKVPALDIRVLILQK